MSKGTRVTANRTWIACFLAFIKNIQIVLNVHNTDEKIFFKGFITSNMVDLFVCVNSLVKKFLAKDLIFTEEEEKKQAEKNDILKGCSPASVKIRMQYFSPKNT